MVVLHVLGSVLDIKNIMAMTSTYFALSRDIFNLITGLISLILGLVSYGWVAMWLGLVTRKANVAVMKTFLFVMVIPWFATVLLQLIQFFPMRALSQTVLGLPIMTLVTTLLWLVKDIAFIIWARRNLYSRLREIASGGAIVRKPANILPPANVPPVIVIPA